MTSRTSPRVPGPGATAPVPSTRPAATPDVGSQVRLGNVVRTAGITCVLLLVVLQGVAPDLVDRVAVPLAVVGVVLGIPHGAVDHLVPFWAGPRTVRPRALARVLAGYLVVLAGALACALAWPLPTVWAFLVASAFHFGRGEVVAAAELAGRRPPPVTGDVPAALAHGLVTVGLPLAAWPAVSLPLLDLVAPGFAGTPTGLLHAVLVASYVMVVLGVVRLVGAGRRIEAGELVLLTVLFSTVPAPAAFGVYFGAWHAARHAVRLVTLPRPDGRVDVRAGVARCARAATVPTLAALVLLLVVSRSGSRTVLAAELITLVALTAPHLAVVAALDRRSRLRTGSAAPADGCAPADGDR